MLNLTTTAAHRGSRWAAVAVLCGLVLGLTGCGSESGPVDQARATSPGLSAEQDAAQPRAGFAADAAAKPGAHARAQHEARPEVSTETEGEVAGRGRPPLAEAATPVRVQMPRLNIDAALDPLHLDADRVLVPPRYGRAGWYEAGPEPGEAGRAVVAGHVDSKTGPDVFAALHRARKGDRIVVKLADGSTLRFLVERVEAHAQRNFPTAQVYGGPRKRAEIRLITCTGEYVNGRYQDNLIVFGTLVR